MNIASMREKIFEEIAHIPDDKVPEIYDVLHNFRLGLGVQSSHAEKILQLAGSWNDLSEDDFRDFLKDVQARRTNAFRLRRDHETSVD
jgi:hypothetical protein